MKIRKEKEQMLKKNFRREKSRENMFKGQIYSRRAKMARKVCELKKRKKIIGTSHKEAKLFLERKRVGLNSWTDKY
jgi:hypothetical protein